MSTPSATSLDQLEAVSFERRRRLPIIRNLQCSQYRVLCLIKHRRSMQQKPVRVDNGVSAVSNAEQIGAEPNGA
jgi:hypothetical protein